MWQRLQLCSFPDTPMQKLLRMSFFPSARMPWPATYSVRSQFQWLDRITSTARPLWQLMQAAVTSCGLANRTRSCGKSE